MDSKDTEIREFYNGYRPPRYAFKTVQTLLRSVPEKYLVGLECIVLTNQSGHPRRYRLGKVKSRKWRFPQSLVIGRYHPAHPGGRAWIELFIDKLTVAVSQYSWIPFIREVVFAHVLFHEIGHHIHTTVAPEHHEKEDVADSWRGKLTWNFVRKKYWYLVPVRKPLGRFLKEWSKSL